VDEEGGSVMMMGYGPCTAGDEVLGVSEQDVTRDNSYLYVRHQASGGGLRA